MAKKPRAPRPQGDAPWLSKGGPDCTTPTPIFSFTPPHDETTSGLSGNIRITPIFIPLALRANALTEVIRREPLPAFETFAEFRIRRAFRLGF